MFCVSCGTEMPSDSKYCPNCGQSIAEEKDKAAPNTNVENKPIDQVIDNSTAPSSKGKFWLLPVITAVIALALPVGLYFYEVHVTNQVESARGQAEKLALQGKLEGALILVDQGLLRRPNNKPLQADKMFIQLGKKVDDYLITVDTLIQKQDYPKALDEVALAEKEIADNKGNFFDLLHTKIEDTKTGVTVLQIKKDMNSKSTIEELASLLTKVSAYNVQEAKDIAIVLKKRIGEIAYGQANDYLQKKDFTSAMAAIDNGLNYDSDDTKLVSFKLTVAKQQQDFQKSQEQRIQQAMIVAAQEGKNNRTNAVQILECNGAIDPYGDFLIGGKIKNTATRPITFVVIYYSVFDANNNALSSGSTYVYPNYLNPNDSGSFQTTEYGLVNAVSVKVTKTTWYLD